MHGGIDPLLLGENLYAKGINVSSRNGLIHTRPGFRSLGQIPTTGTDFQGAYRWSLNSGDRVVVAISGRILSFNLELETWTDLGVLMNPIADKVYMYQADKWLVLQDGASPVKALEEGPGNTDQLYSGTNPDQVCYPPGTVGIYGFGRVHFSPTFRPDMTPSVVYTDPASMNAIPDISTDTGRVGFVSSDIRDSFGNPQWVLRMSEHRELARGGLIALPQELGFVTGMSLFRNAQTGTGTGPLVVFAREGVCAFDPSIPRDQWKPSSGSSETNFGQVLFFGAGSRSPDAIIQANNDIIFVDAEGQLRTLRYTTSQLAGGGGVLSNTPMSNELTPFIDRSDKQYLPYASAAYADNRCLFTIDGEDNPSFRCLGSLDFAQVYGVSGPETPSFDGAWTGFKFARVLSARYHDAIRALVVAKQGDQFYLLWLDESATQDGETNIESQLITRYLPFGQAQFAGKALKEVEVWLTDVATPVSFEVLFRPSGYPKWISLGTKTVDMVGTGVQSRRAWSFGVDPDTVGCHPVTQEALYVSTEFQFALKWTGRCSISKFRAIADTLDEAPPVPCEEDNPDGVSMDSAPGVELDDYSYEVTI